MSPWKRIVVITLTVLLAPIGTTLCLVSFLMLFVFVEGPITPRSYTPQEKAEKRTTGIWAGASGLASFGGLAVALWWGLRRPRTGTASVSDCSENS